MELLKWGYMLVVVVFISACLAAAMYIQACGVLGRPVDKKGCTLYCGIICAIHLVLNIWIIATDWAYFNPWVWELGLSNIHCLILPAMLYLNLRENPVKVFSSVALALFSDFTFYNVLDHFLVRIVPPETSIIGWTVPLYYNVLPHFTLLCFSLLLSYLLRRVNFSTYFAHLFTGRGKALATLVVCLLLMNGYTLLRLFFPLFRDSIYYSVAALCAIFIALFCVQAVSLYAANKAQIHAQQQTILQQQAHVALLEELQSEVRGFRHDFHNLLSGMALQASAGDVAGIRAFLQTTASYFDQKLGEEIKQNTQLSKVENIALRSLLSLKLAEMRKRGIKVELEVLFPVSRLGMRQEDFLRCAGILLDNALEEAAHSKEGRVRILLLQEPGECCLAVSNSCAEKPDLRAMRTRHYTTKGAGHGTGLASYRRILAGYPNCVTRTFWQEGMLTQEMRLSLAG